MRNWKKKIKNYVTNLCEGETLNLSLCLSNLANYQLTSIDSYCYNYPELSEMQIY